MQRKRRPPEEVLVPREILLNRSLSAASKLVWAARQLTDDTKELRLLTGLSSSGVSDAQRRLRDHDLLRPQPIAVSRAGCATLPIALLSARSITGQAKLLYAAVQYLPGFSGRSVTTTWAELRSFTDLCLNTLRRAVTILEAQGWLSVHRPGLKGSFRLTLHNPQVDRIRRAIAAADRRLQRAPYLGEALMREWLALLVDCEEFEDDASPGFLINPYTNEEMQFDRFYPPSVAFEFNGPQHYGPTRLFPDAEEARRQQARDLIKVGICTARGIRLVIVHPEDLTLEGMRHKVEGPLSLRCLDGMEELITYLEVRSAAYRRSLAALQA